MSDRLVTIDRLAAGPMIVLTLWQTDGLATASVHNSADVRRVVCCIRQAVGGQKWLEVTL